MQIIPVSVYKYLCGLIMLSGLASFLNAQEIHITFSGGGEFSMTSGGYRSEYTGNIPNSGALTLNKGAIIQTGAGSVVELRIEPGGTRIKITENTSLAYNGPGPEALSTLFSLMYGRIRIATGVIWPHGEGSAVYVRAGQVETAFRIGDAGIDYIVNAEKTQLTRGEPLLTVYNFHGNSEIRPLPLNPTRVTAPGFLVYEYESLSYEMANSISYIERKPLSNEIIHYWNRHNFSDGAPLLAIRDAETALLTQEAAPVTQEAAPVQYVEIEIPQFIERIEYVHTNDSPAIINYVYPDNPFDKRLFRVKNALITTGMFFTLGGIGMQIAGSYGIPDLDTNVNSMIVNLGYMPLVIGLIFTGAALVINPQNMVQNASN